MSSLFFNAGQGNSVGHQIMLMPEDDLESKKVIKENTRFDEEFIEKQQFIEHKILNPHQ